jgi:hypothetical protein
VPQGVGQFLVGSVGVVQPLRRRPFDAPAFDLVGQFGGDLPGLTGRLAWAEAIEPAFAVGVEPALDGAWVDGQALGNLLVGPVPGGQADFG